MVSIVAGRTTGAFSMSDWNCINSSLTTMPPSTRRALMGMPESCSIACTTSMVW